MTGWFRPAKLRGFGALLARGLADLTLIAGVAIGTLPELADWTLAADKVITF